MAARRAVAPIATARASGARRSAVSQWTCSRASESSQIARSSYMNAALRFSAAPLPSTFLIAPSPTFPPLTRASPRKRSAQEQADGPHDEADHGKPRIARHARPRAFRGWGLGSPPRRAGRGGCRPPCGHPKRSRGASARRQRVRASEKRQAGPPGSTRVRTLASAASAP